MTFFRTTGLGRTLVVLLATLGIVLLTGAVPGGEALAPSHFTP